MHQNKVYDIDTGGRISLSEMVDRVRHPHSHVAKGRHGELQGVEDKKTKESRDMAHDRETHNNRQMLKSKLTDPIGIRVGIREERE